MPFTKKPFNYLRRRKAYRPRKPIKKLVRSMIKRDGETKSLIAYAAITPGTTTNWQCVNEAITVGSGLSNRVGDQIRPVSLSMRIQMKQHASNTTGEQMRILVVRDKDCRGALPADADINLTPPMAGGESTMFCPSNLNYQKRFQILKDLVVTFDTSQRQKFLKFTKKLSGIIQYGTTGDDYQNNSLFIAVVALDNTNKSTVNYHFRLRYKDK